MLKANAWPYPVFEAVEFEVAEVLFDGRSLEHKKSVKGIVVDGRRLRGLGTGTLTIRTTLKTGADEIAREVLEGQSVSSVSAGFKILCESSKYRTMVHATPGTPQEIAIPLQMIRGGVQVVPVFAAATSCKSITGVPLKPGALLAYASSPLTIAIDEDWTGEVIPVRWVDFGKLPLPLPKDALFHIEVTDSGGVLPELWLNEAFKNDLGTVINHTGLGSAQGIAGHVLRHFLWLQFWQRVVPWAVKYESDDNESWPASRIAGMWRVIFTRNKWEWPRRDEIDGALLEELSGKIQHHLKQGEAISQVRRVWLLQD